MYIVQAGLKLPTPLPIFKCWGYSVPHMVKQASLLAVGYLVFETSWTCMYTYWRLVPDFRSSWLCFQVLGLITMYQKASVRVWTPVSGKEAARRPTWLQEKGRGERAPRPKATTGLNMKLSGKLIAEPCMKCCVQPQHHTHIKKKKSSTSLSWGLFLNYRALTQKSRVQ